MCSGLILVGAAPRALHSIDGITWTYPYMHIYTRVHRYRYIRACVYIYIFVYICVFTCLYMYLLIRVHMIGVSTRF